MFNIEQYIRERHAVLKKTKEKYGGFNQMPLEDSEHMEYMIALGQMVELSELAYRINLSLYNEINGYTY